MGWRFRRSVGVGSFRLTATKRGFSTSVGVPGARIGINTKGQVRATGGIPGTGLYDTEIVGHVGGKQPSHTSHSASRPAAPDGGTQAVYLAPEKKSHGKTVAIVVMGVIIVVLLIVLGTR